MTFEEVWTDLERARSPTSSGYLVRRVKPDAKCDLFLGVARPSNQRLLLLRFQTPQINIPGALPSFRGVDLTWQRAEPGKDDATLQVALLDRRFADEFSHLASDLVDVATREAGDSAAAACIQRLERWRRFFERGGGGGLGRDAQQGLYGELWFLRERLMPIVAPTGAIKAWVGPTGAAQDFQIQGCAIEVKATAATEPRKVFISNERQLDDTGFHVLYLFVLSLDVRTGVGETLNDIVEAHRSVLFSADTETQDSFENHLLEAGYFQAHAVQYDGTGYAIREANLFLVQEGFPRITGQNLGPGVGDVHYSIALSACRPFAADNRALGELLVRRDGDGRRP